MNAKSARKPLPIHTIRSLRIVVSLALFISIFSTASISPVAAASNGLVFNVRQNATGAITANLAKDQISSGTLGYCGSATLSTINFTSWASPITCSFPYSQSYASGFIKAPFSGMVTLTTSSDDGVQVQVNDWIGINNWDDHAAESDSMAIPMVAGNYYPIKIWYASGGGGGVLSLSWSWSGQSSFIVPSGSLYQSENDFDSCVARSGTGPNCPGSSALQIKQLTGTNSDGLYWIDLNDGSGAKATYSIMNSVHGGGWMLAMKGKDSASTFGYDSAYWKDANLLNSERPSRNNQEDVDAKYLPFTKSRATDVMVIFPDYAASTYKGAYPSSGDGFAWSENLANNRTWQSGDGNSFDFNQGGDPSGTSACASYPSTMQTIFTNSSRCLIRKVETSYSESRNPYDPIGNGLFFSQTQIRFFGFNYASRSTGDQMYKARFGFGWNENGSTEEGSNDGSGGIGLKSGSVTITAGTRYGCCAVQGGINGVNNNGGGAASQTNFAFELFVKNTTTITISGASNLRTSIGSSASTTYSADQGNTPTFALSPVIPGISINSSTGVVTAANSLSIGTYRETVTVSNALGASAVRAVTIEVIAASGETDDAMTFSGANYLTSSTESPFDASSGTTFTLSAWVKPNVTTGGRIIASKNLQYSIYINNGLFGFNMFGVTAGNGSTGLDIPQAPARSNEWQHVELARNGSNLKFYLNAQLVYSDATLAAGNSITNGSNQFTIGGIVEGALFSGEIDQVLLSSSDRSGFVQTDMNAYQPSDAGLIAHYDFNEGFGTKVFNRQSSSSSATDLSLNSSSNTWSAVESTTSHDAYTVVRFNRSYLTAFNGWKIPTGISRVSTMVVAGGGAGGTRAGGGGGAGGLIFESITSVIPARFETVTVGVGGIGNRTIRGGDGGGSSFSNRLVAAGGGSGGGAIGANDVYRVGNSGGSGGGAAGAYSGATTAAFGGGNTPSKTPAQGRDGGNALVGNAWPGGGGGGISGVGANGSFSTSTYFGGKGGDGLLDPISGTTTCFSTGGGGGVNAIDYTASAGNSGTCSGKGNSPNGGAGTSNSTTPSAATANTGAGGGGSGWSSSSDAMGGSGGSGVVIIRWITASAPTFTAPSTIDTTTAGLRYKFQMSGSASSLLTRSFSWQSSTDTGTVWSTVQTGFSDSYTTTTLETTTSGARYRYRVIVTDSDTAGLSITDTSTSFYLIINPRITVTSSTGSAIFNQKYGESRTAVFSFAFGTGTRTPAVVSTTNNQNGRITWSNFNRDSATVRVGTGLPVGTYFETLTVTDSVTAFTTQSISITVSRADTITVTTTLSTNSVTYNELPANVTVTQTVTGLVNSETATVTTTFTGSSCQYGGECKVGDIAPGGGYVFYVSPTVINSAAGVSTGGIYLSTAPQTWNGSVADPNASWGCGGTSIAGTSAAVGSGAENTRLINASCATVGIASRLAADSTAEAFTDWFIPSIDELTLIYNNLKVNSLSNLQSWNYWSSTQATGNPAGQAKYWWFGSGAVSGDTDKNNSAGSNMYVRPIRAFSPTALTSNTIPTDANIYRVGSTFSLSSPATLSNYQGFESVTATLTINKARQAALSIGQYESYPNISSYPLNVYGGSGPGIITRTLVSAGSAGCTIVQNFIITATNVGTCTVSAVKAGTRNYFIESTTATILWITWSANNALQSLGGNHAIPLSGGNQMTVRTETVTASAFSNTSGGAISSAAVGTTIRINSTGFAGLAPAQITATFRPYEDGVVTAVTSTYVEVVIPVGAATGVIALDSPRGVAYTPSFTISP